MPPRSLRVAQAFGCTIVIHEVERLKTSGIQKLAGATASKHGKLFPPEAPTLMIEIKLYLTCGSENFKKARTPQGITHLGSGPGNCTI
jgi:hypothetical protein